MEESVDSGLVSLEAFDKVLLEALHAIRENAHAVQQVADHQRLEDVQFELAVHATNGSGNVVAHNLGADHGKGLALRGVDLARHDRRTGLVLRQNQLSKTAARSRSEVTDILRDLEEGASQSVQGAGGLNDGVVSGKNLELVGGGLELGAGQLGDLLSNTLSETLEGVQTGSDGGTTLGKVAEVGEGSLNALDVAVQLSDVARELLTESQGGGVLQMSTTDFDDLVELLDFLLESVTKAAQGREQSVLELQDGGDMHGSGERVIGRGGHVDVVVGVDRLLGAHGTAKDLNGTVRDNLVGVHVGLSARTGLPDNQREMVH